MRIDKVQHYDIKTLVDKLRSVTMLKDPNVKIYKDVYISVERLNINCLVPPQNYVLNYELQNKLELKYELEKQGIDLFKLNGYVEFTLINDNIKRDLLVQLPPELLDNLDKRITLLPPIVEESIEEDGTVVPIICDGMHRCYLARIERKTIDVIFIRGIPKEYPYYAYPMIESWNNVDRINKIEKDYIKKWHRIQDNKKLYRNFDSVFGNCSKPRGSGK